MKLIIVPVRLNSSRLPNKALLKIDKLPLFVHVLRSLEKLVTKCLFNHAQVYISSPDLEVLDQAERFGIYGAIHTPNTKCGTHSVLEAANLLINGCGFIQSVINWQVDYPDVDGQILKDMFTRLESQFSNIVTPYYWSNDYNPNNVKVATAPSGQALYFSRSQIPYGVSKYKIHVGVYGFPRHQWLKILDLYRENEKLENVTENLEQLLWLENGYPINTFECEPMYSINTKEDYENYLSGRKWESNPKISTR